MRSVMLSVVIVFFVSGWPTELMAAGTHDHFANRRQAAQAAEQQRQRAAARVPWGGPTTGRNWWTPVRQHQHRVVIPNGGFFFPAQPQFYYSPYYRAPRFYYVPAPRHIHIEQRLRLP